MIGWKSNKYMESLAIVFMNEDYKKWKLQCANSTRQIDNMCLPHSISRNIMKNYQCGVVKKIKQWHERNPDQSKKGLEIKLWRRKRQALKENWKVTINEQVQNLLDLELSTL